MAEKSPAKFIIVALLLSTAVLSVLSVLFAIINGYSFETIYATSFVIMQVAFFCVIAYLILRMREWLNSFLEMKERQVAEISEMKKGLESLRETVEMMDEKTDNIERIITGRN